MQFTIEEVVAAIESQDTPGFPTPREALVLCALAAQGGSMELGKLVELVNRWREQHGEPTLASVAEFAATDYWVRVSLVEAKQRYPDLQIPE